MAMAGFLLGKMEKGDMVKDLWKTEETLKILQKAVDVVKKLANARLGKVLGAEFGSRMNKMDTYTKELYIADPEKWIANYGKGGKLNNLEKIDEVGKFFEVKVQNGKILHNKSGNTWWNDQLDFIYKDGKISFWDKHSYMTKGGNVDYAGEFYINPNGVAQRFTTKSGHYRPNRDDIEMQQAVVNALQKQYGINLNDIPWKDR